MFIVEQLNRNERDTKKIRLDVGSCMQKTVEVVTASKWRAHAINTLHIGYSIPLFCVAVQHRELRFRLDLRMH